MRFQSTVDFSNLSNHIRAIAQAAGQSIPVVVDSEMAAILSKTIEFTPAAAVAKLRDNSESREWGMHNTGVDPKRPFTGVLSPGGFKRYKYSNRYPAAVWEAIAAQRKARLIAKIAARGLAKKSWLALAGLLGLPSSAPGYVKSAKASTGRDYPGDISASRNRTPDGYQLTIINSQPTAMIVGGADALRRAVKGRSVYFEKNIQKGVFDSLETIARAYPGLKINRN